MLDKEITLAGKFYLKNGAVIEEKFVFDINNELPLVRETIENFKTEIKIGLEHEDGGFQISFGNTIFRGKDISAVTFTEK